MNSLEPPQQTTPPPSVAGKIKKRGWRRFGGKFLFISVAAHLLLGLGATFYIVQTITAKRKLTFKAGPPSPNPSQRSVEHKVQMAKKQASMSAPAQSKRIVSTGVSKVSLPEIPVMPTTDNPSTKMAGMAGTGIGTGPIAGTMGTSGGGGGSGPTLFGFAKSNSGSLVGTFYDLKQTSDRKPTGMDEKKWADFVQKWVKGSWNVDELKKFYAGPKPLYAPYLFVPIISADEGPKAFNLEKKVQPRLWLAHYKGTVIPPVGGKYRFVGLGDDILIIRFKGRIVFSQGRVEQVLAEPLVQYKYAGLMDGRGPEGGKWFEVTAGERCEMEILIGECPGGLMHAYLLLEKSDGAYEKTASGLPILPLFRVSKVEPKLGKEMAGKYPPYSIKEAPWGIAAAASKSFFDTPR